MDKKTRNLLIIVAIIVVAGPLCCILLGLGGFIASDLFRTVQNTIPVDDWVEDDASGVSIGSIIKYAGIAIVVIGIPLVLFFTRKKN